MIERASSPGARRGGLWFGLFGGAVAWLMHLIGSSMAAEWGCFAGLFRWQWLGLTAIAWMVIAISVVTLLVAVAATAVAYRRMHPVAGRESQTADPHETNTFLARAGFATSGLFVFIILVETVPILFYLTEC